MITTTAQRLITSTLKLINVLEAEELPTASELQDGLESLNGMIDGWGTARQTMLSVARYEVALVSNQQSYTLGEAGDFPLEPPLSLDHVGLIYPDTDPVLELPLALLSDDQYATVVLKTFDNPLPQFVYYSRTTAELATVYFWPGPSQDLTVALYAPVSVTQFSNTTVEVTLSAGYYEALRYNLGIRLIPEYSAPARPDILQLATESLANMKRANFRPDDLQLDPALMSGRIPYNIYSDTGG